LNRPELTTPTKNHGLMGFFNKKGQLISQPDDDAAHGRIKDHNGSTSWNILTIGHRQRLDCRGALVENMGGDALSMVGMHEREE
jgi:hypothetical protein